MTPSVSFQRLKAFFHALSKVNTEATQYVFESRYKSAHSVKNEDIWVEHIDYALNVNEADNFVASHPTIIKKYNKFQLTEIPGSNGQGYYINDNGVFVKDWISPVDIPHPTNGFPSLGYEAKLYKENGDIIPLTQGVYIIDYFAGIVLFQEGYTPTDMGWGNPKISCYVYIGKKGLEVNHTALEYGEVNSFYTIIENQNETKDLAIFESNKYRTFEFLISVTDFETNNFLSSKIVAHHNNSDVVYSHFSILGKKTVDFNIILENGYVKLKGTSLKTNQHIKIISHAVKVSENSSSSSSSSSSL